MKSELSFSFYLSSFCWLHLWFFSLILWIKKKHTYANRLLALFLFCFSFIHVQHVLLQAGVLSLIPLFDPICGIILSALGPLFYFYARALTGYELKRNDLWHLVICLPAFIHLVFLLSTHNINSLSKYYYADTAQSNSYTTINTVLLMGMLAYFIVYLLMSVQTINNYLKNVQQEYSKIENIRLKWLKELIWLLAFFSFLLSPIVLYFSNAATSSLVLGYFSTLIYFIIVYKSLSTSVIFTSDIRAFMPTLADERPKYNNSVQSTEKISEQGKLVEQFLANSPLLYDEQLSLKQMADQLALPPYLLSEIINRYFAKSFFELINTARIEKAKTELLRLDTLNITIEGIGYNCGFGSKAAFYRAFKKVTGLTPKAYLKAQSITIAQLNTNIHPQNRHEDLLS